MLGAPSSSSPDSTGTGHCPAPGVIVLGLTQGCIHPGLGNWRGKGPALSPNTGTSYSCSCVTCCIKQEGAGGAASGGGYKGGSGKRQVHASSPAPGARMTAMLPSLVLALLCLLWAEAEVPVQPGFNAEKVMAQGAHPAGPAWAGGAGWGRVPMLSPQAWLDPPGTPSARAAARRVQMPVQNRDSPGQLRPPVASPPAGT